MSETNEVRRGVKAVIAEWLRSQTTQNDLKTMLDSNDQRPLIDVLSDAATIKVFDYLEESNA